jgi:hypothetical protein
VEQQPENRAFTNTEPYIKAGTISGTVGMDTRIVMTNISKNQKQRHGGEYLSNIQPPHVLQRAKESEIIGFEKTAVALSDKTSFVSIGQ